MSARASNEFMCVHHSFMQKNGLRNSSLKCDLSVLIVFGLGVGEGECPYYQTDVQLVHRSSPLSYNDNTNMGGMGKESLPHICTSYILHLCLGLWFCHHRHLCAKSAMSVLIIWSLVIPCISYTFFLVEPNALTPYIGCYATQHDSIAIFFSWVLLLLYDKGAVVDYYRITQSAMCWKIMC